MFIECNESPRPYSGAESPSPAPAQGEKEVASFSMIEQYLELLYEDLPDKTRGSVLILELAKDPNNLEELVNSGKLNIKYDYFLYLFVYDS